MKRLVEVSSLSEYVSVISKNKLSNWISRGENKKFDNIIASAFRYQAPIEFNNMIFKFYNTIGNNITGMQRENFVAFSQHHGIPTNLVDFSTSPLVSLFFSCYEPDTKSSDNGYVYFVSDDRLIDISEMMNYSTSRENIFQSLMHFKSSILPIITKLYTYEHTHILEIQQMVIEWTNKLKLDKALRKKYRRLFSTVNSFQQELKSTPIYAFADYSQKILNQLIEDNRDDDGNTSDYILWGDDVDSCRNLFKNVLENMRYTYCDDIMLILILIRTVLGE